MTWLTLPCYADPGGFPPYRHRERAFAPEVDASPAMEDVIGGLSATHTEYVRMLRLVARVTQ